MRRSQALLVCAFFILTGTASAGVVEFSAEQRRIAQVQEILGVADEGDQMVVVLERLMPELTQQNGVASEAQLRQLASAVIKGVMPGLLRSRVASLATASDEQPKVQKGTGGIGTWGDRMSLAKQLVSAAGKASDPKQARTFARAALVLGAQDAGSGILPNLLRDPRISTLAELNQKQLDELKALTAGNSKTIAAVHSDMIGAATHLGALIKAQKGGARSLDITELESFLSNLRSGWQRADEISQRQRWMFANFAWRCCCLARAVGDQHAAGRLDEAVVALRDNTTDENELRWLTEALALPGGVPDGPGLTVISSPNQTKPGHP
jgi:hypothetical protein